MHDLVTFDKKPTLVLYRDGTCESLKSAIETRKQELSTVRSVVNPATTKISNICAFLGADEKLVLTYFVKDSSSEDLEFVYFKLDNEAYEQEGTLHKHKFSRREQGALLSGCTLVEGESFPSLISICKS